MIYEQFCTALCSTLTALTAPEVTVTRQQIPKNNGVLLNALCLCREKTLCSPIVYLDPLYQEHCRGKSVDALALQILRGIRRDRPLSFTLPDLILDFQNARESICFRLISLSLNEPLLNELPWFPFLDLAIVFYLRLPVDSGAVTSVPITNRLAGLWQLTPDELCRIAFQNTPLLLPPYLAPLEDLLREHAKEFLPAADPKLSPDRPRLYVLTNHSSAFGAACLLYDGLIKKFAGQVQSDVLILPSSIHEVLLLPSSCGLAAGELAQTVKWVNETIVDPQELLSDTVYLYTRADDAFSICQPVSPSSHDTPETGGKTNP